MVFINIINMFTAITRGWLFIMINTSSATKRGKGYGIKMAATVAIEMIWNAPIAKNLHEGLLYRYTNFGAFIVNPTIRPFFVY